jgi:hypothetical protein
MAAVEGPAMAVATVVPAVAVGSATAVMVVLATVAVRPSGAARRLAARRPILPPLTRGRARASPRPSSVGVRRRARRRAM